MAMKETDLQISNEDNVYRIKVEGRANFEYAVPLRHLGNCMTPDLKKIILEAGQCTFMDSTFMGVLSMLGLKSKKIGATVEIHCMAPNVRALLKGLGVDRLFTFSDESGNITVESWSTLAPKHKTMLDTAHTVAEAHKTLVEADESNAKRFEDVIKYADADVERLEKQ